MLKEVANRYKVLATLGEGGMGTVFLVEDSTNGQQVALKVLSGKTGMDENQILQFKQEFRVMAKLKHPNNCEVYDYGLMPDGAPYFTMEVVPGKGLDELIPVAPDQLTNILNQLGQALGYIHQQGFVHCDIKPENVRVKPDGTVKLMDFGLMEVAGQSGGAIKGTLAYIAPEVAKRDRIDQRSDIYSLGAVTYQLLTGETPFKGATPIEVLRAHLNQSPRPLRELNATIPTLMESVILKMMAKEPIARYQSTHDVLNALGIEVGEGQGASLLASAFIGRQGELARLQEALIAVKRDRAGQTLWLQGAAGLGKSRLLGEFRFAVQLEEIPFLYGAGNEQRSPYGPFVEVLRAALPLCKEACPAELAEYAPLLSKLLPELADGRPVPQREPEQEKILIQAAITTLILKVAAKSGAVMVLEDWDLADALSVEALTYLQRNAAGANLLVVGSSRDKALAKGATIELDALTPDEATAMVKSMLGVDTMPQALASQLCDLTGGNPSHLSAMLDHLLRTGTLNKTKGKWQLPEQLAPEDIPGDIADLLLERFSALSAASLQVAHLGAVLGQPFGLKIVAALLGLDEDTLFDALDELQQGKIFAYDTDAQLYAFATAELKDALYNNLPIEARIGLHTAVAEYLEGQLPAGEPDLTAITTLAQHFLKSRHGEKAIHVAFKAAVRNRDIFANDTALGLLEAGLAVMDGLPNADQYALLRSDYQNHLAAVKIMRHQLDDARVLLDAAMAVAEAAGDKHRKLHLLANLGLYCMNAQSSDKLKEGVEVLEAAIALADELGEMRLRMRCGANLGRCLFFLGQNARAREVFEHTAALPGAKDYPYWYARAVCFLGYLRATGSDNREQGFTDLQEATELQERIGDKFGQGYSFMLLSNIQMHAGRFAEAVQSGTRYAEIMQELGSNDDYTIALLNLTISHAEMGQFDQARLTGEKCHAAAIEHKSKMGVPISQAVLASVALYRGDLKKAEADITAAQELAKATNTYVYSMVIPYVIETWLHMGRLQDALGAAQEARDLVSSTGNTEIETRLWTYMGEIHARLGENPAARSYFERAKEAAAKADELHILARAEKGLAWMDIMVGKKDDAEANLARALELSRAQQLRYLEAECHYLQGQLALEQGAPESALGHFEEASAQASELGAASLEAIALYGQSKVTKAPAQASALLKAAKTKQQILLEQLDETNAEAFLSFMERAQLQRDEGATGGPAAPGAVVPAQPVLAEDASPAERGDWLSKEIAGAAASQAAEAGRLATIVAEFEALKTSGFGSDARVAELEASNRRMEQLIKFSMAVSHVTDLDQVLEQAVDLIVEITAAERGFLLFFENGQIRSKVSRVNVDRRSPMDWQFSKSIAEKVLTTGEVVCVFDALSDTQFNQAQSVVDLNLRTVICVPMRIKGKMIGAIYVDRQSINDNFNPNDLELVMSLAAQASMAIENARVHQEWVDKSKRLELLNNLSKTISGSLNMEEVLDLIVKMTLEVSRAERGFLFLLNDDRRRLICRAARDIKGSLPLDEDHEISQSICTKVLTTGLAENVADAMNDEEFQFQQSIMALNLRMVMCVPISAKGEIIGLLYVDSQAVVNAFSDKDLGLLEAIAGHAAVSLENAKLYTKTQHLAEEVRKTFYSFVHALGASIDAKHPLTSGHSWRVTEYSVRLARKLGLTEQEVENIRIAGLLHDVGKIGTPDHILQKPGSFSQEEYEIMKKHVVHTKEILDTIYFPEHQRHIPEVAGAHHEKWDGKGYPNGTAGTEIPYGGRILALGDVFDAITSKRDYREAMPLSQALNIIRQGTGTHFDPDLVPVFIEMIEEQGVIQFDRDPEAQPSAAHAQEVTG